MKNKIKNIYVILPIIALLSISAGLCMFIAPDKISDWVIRGVGFISILEGVSLGVDIFKKHKSRL